jgi:RNA polymerase sigma-70 factor (ECF subfamily)
MSHNEVEETRSESDLLAAARAGDRAALATLLQQHQEKVFGFGVRMCGDPEDAKDVAQETLMTMARTVGDFRGDASLATWLYTVARSFCIKKRRRTKGAPAFHEPLDKLDRDAASSTLTPEQSLIGQQARNAIAAALDALDPEAREVVILRDIEGLTAAEAAETIGISVAALKSRLHRARAELRARLISTIGETDAPATASCPDVLTMLSKKLEDEISPDVCAQMEEHVAGCQHCHSVCESLKKTLALCKALPTPTVPEHVQESLRQAVASALAKRS